MAIGDGAMVFRVSLQIGILLLLVGLTVAPLTLSPGRIPTVDAQAIPTNVPIAGLAPIDDPATTAQLSLTPQTAVAPDTCHGDEVISFAPAAPVVGQEMLIAVSSATGHGGLYMSGTEKLTTATETVGQLGRVWLWSLTPRLAGPHRFQLFVDFTKFCTEASVEVGPAPPGSLDPLLSGTPISLGPSSFPTLTPLTSFNDNSSNSNSDNGNSDSNGNSGSGNGNLGNVNDNIESIKPPIIDTVTCGDNRLVTINGRRFGSSQTAASGKVLVQATNPVVKDPVEVTTYLEWKGSEIAVVVQVNADKFNTLYVVNSAGFDSFDLVDGADCGGAGGLSTKKSR